ncbi:MAG: oxidoreductase [Limnobacter sp.]|jgi:acrylyl-CoA reductase (NADPH)|uniref:acrylyl-CoA reductase (NADPH) n=1 Tax=unclassified Limnobacter TaxID=2630203 RepID=UPI000C3B2AFF|nr:MULTISPECIES: MDR family oxidoreductase [unclassified Limnobacter]MAG82157.1 oxidoreductase [Sutterellaceae bacterium]MBA4315342.1 oxidoreductase [Alcaligenaceae bacterium]MBT83915.1 oxidoreductase [Sutterellaceae bacterium]MDZ4051386.1 MDR family oxidoreductase [Limnobacter sp.]RZO90789.1 MAG: oxidoreductase [Limnobacter sp.]|tara:strand:+ start:5033 stop:6016 length:984 start_codon:yes stop_codon:yes gene_type:complete
MFKAVFLQKNEQGEFKASVQELDESQLPGSGDVLVQISHSTLNYKDGLAICNKSPVVRQWPMVAGIDGAGTVLESAHSGFKPGDEVILNGFGVGETHWGCLAEKAKLKGDWLIKRPEGLSAAQAMAIGTAGYTAMLCVLGLEKSGVKPENGEVLVTGATGGVGSIAIVLLNKLGYTVVATSGKPEQAEFLKGLGASEVLDRKLLSEPGKSLQRERWAGVVDCVGSHTLANACAQTKYGGTVTACGLAQGMDLPSSVAPFILRGVALKGIDSVMAPLAVREEAWRRLASDLDLNKLNDLTRTLSLEGAIEAAAEIMAGTNTGRVLIKI